MIGDHPRSRGVYCGASRRVSLASGSSPLARGLLGVLRGSSDRPGIIPARAGFTSGVSSGLAAKRDHPRSRGVYMVPAVNTAPNPGSSPLARGLPGRLVVRRLGVRIIPARAGFTACAWFQVVMIADHPRSRGVYLSRRRMRRMLRGSSPLARGLPHCTAPYTCSRGIIPARAGFTGGAPAESDGPGDHPRSRGVYPSFSAILSAVFGSSPLARGLRVRVLLFLVVVRIIPARAGFTGPGPRRRCPHRDHPRSRGVYIQSAVRTVADFGSSPLARGLPRSIDDPHRR